VTYLPPHGACEKSYMSRSGSGKQRGLRRQSHPVRDRGLRFKHFKQPSTNHDRELRDAFISRGSNTGSHVNTSTSLATGVPDVTLESIT